MRDEQRNDHSGWVLQSLVLMIGMGILIAFNLSLPPTIDRGQINTDLYLICLSAMKKAEINFSEAEIHANCLDWQIAVWDIHEEVVIACNKSNRQRDQFVNCLADADILTPP